MVFPLKVLYEDETLAAIFKPAGIAVSGNSFKTVANALVQNLKPSKNPDAVIPKPVHRLDYATTGVLLIGKTQSSITALNNLFKNKEIQKTYLAICIGDMPNLDLIDTPIDGKQASSKIQLIDRIESEKYGYLNLLKLFPETGRKHQLRKHLSEIGHPILGDQVYGKEGLILKGKGLYLHAMSLEFTHPNSNQLIKIKAEPPNRFQKLFPSY